MIPLVSILIPAFNAERWIAETIQSALGQTWSAKEIVIVDDGSRDQTLAIAQRFASKSVKVVTQVNQGAAAARNKAYSLCEGEYIQWLDADDLLAPDKITKQMAILKSDDSRRVLLSSAWGHFIHRRDKAKFVPTPLWDDLSPIEWLLHNLQNGVFLQTASWLVSRELTEATGPWDVRLLGDDDGEYFSRVVRASERVRFAPQAKIFYRRVAYSRLSHVGLSNKKLEAHFLSMELQIRNIRMLEDSGRTRAACLKFLQRFAIYFYPERPDILTNMKRLAAELGGHLEDPRLGWKYAWIQKIFGWTAAKQAQFCYSACKLSVMSSWEKIQSHFEAGPA
jgi:glycosyltransferase involved in cell wall biosynthesis